jgi:hypothetical protein
MFVKNLLRQHISRSSTLGFKRTMSSQATPLCKVWKAPYRPTIDRPSVILYGSIEQNRAQDWQTELGNSLSDLPVGILNPRRDDWDSSWVEDISFPKFKDQVEGDMDHAKLADVIVFYFAPGSLAPVSLLELGMYAGTGKVVVCCPEGFYKRGNVQIVCARYGIPLVGSKEEFVKIVREKLKEKLDTGSATGS